MSHWLYQQYAAPPAQDPTPDKWTPEHPDFARTDKFHSSLLPALAFTFALGQLPVPELSWKPEYPDFAKSDVIHVSQIPFESTQPNVTDSVEPIPEQYYPTYPDFARSRPKTAEFQDYVAPPVEPTKPTPDLSWEPKYPNFARSAPKTAEFQDLSDYPLKPIPRELSWKPSYPDFTRSKQSIIDHPFFFGPEEKVIPVRISEWEPEYPSFTRSTQPAPWFQDLFAPPVEPTKPAPDLYYPTYPNQIHRFVINTDRHEVNVFPVPTPIPAPPVTTVQIFSQQLQYQASAEPVEPVVDVVVPDQYYPTYPDFAPGRAPNVPNQFVTNIEPPDPPELSWKSRYPDFTRSKLSIIDHPFYFAPEEKIIPSRISEWKSIYPDFARYAPQTAWYQPYSEPPIEPTKPAPELSWDPTYPSFIPDRPRSVEFPSAFVPEEKIIPSRISEWEPEYPDFTRSKQKAAEFTDHVSPIIEPTKPAPDLSWDPYYPDFTRSKKSVLDHPYFFGPEEKIIPTRISEWNPEYPDFARVAQSTPWFQDLFSYAIEPTKPLPDLSWSPEYPDFARSADPTPQFQEKADPVFFEPFEDLSWEPEYPDFARAPQRTAEFFPVVWYPVTPPAEPVPDQFYPSYPDFARGPQHPVQVGWVEEDTLPPDPPELSWKPVYDDYVNAKPRSPEFPSAFTPEEKVIPSRVSEWGPSYPDFTRSKKSVLDHPFFFGPEERLVPSRVSEWEPQYPDFPGRDKERTAEFSDFHAVFALPELPVPDLSWESEYPDFARKAYHNDYLRTEFAWFYFTPPPEPVPDQYYPRYPDFARSIDLHVSQIPSFFAVFALPELPVPDLSWDPVYDDFARAPERAAEFQSLFVPEEKIIPSRLSEWEPEYPSITRSTAPVAWFQDRAEPVLVEAPPAPDLSWQSDYPDFARTTTAPEGIWVFDVEPPDPPELSWAPTYPDFAREARRAAEFVEYTSTVKPEIPPLSWEPEYPDFARQAERVPEFPALTRTILPQSDFPVDDIAWVSTYPDFARSAAIDASSIPAFFAVFALPELPIPGDTPWIPVYPDFARVEAPNVDLFTTFRWNTETPPPVPDLSWSPTFPDFARPDKGIELHQGLYLRSDLPIPPNLPEVIEIVNRIFRTSDVTNRTFTESNASTRTFRISEVTNRNFEPD